MLEYFDGPSLDLLRGAYSQIPPAASAALLIEQIADGLDEEDADDAWLDRLDRQRARLRIHGLARPTPTANASGYSATNCLRL